MVVALVVLLPVIVVGERVRRGVGRRIARWGVSVVAALCGVRFEVRGHPSRSSTASVVVPNHSSPMDIPALLWADSDVRFMAAADLFHIPLLAAAMRALRAVPIDRRDRDRADRQVDDLVQEVRAGYTGAIAIFAEGGIAPFGQRLPFKSGAFSLAIRTGSPVVPVVIHGSDRVLRPRGRLLVRPGLVTVEFLDAIETVGLTFDDRQVLGDHVRDLICSTVAAAT